MEYDVLAIGNAIVDILERVDDKFLAAEGMPKGAMTLITEPKAKALSIQVKNATERSGGSAANTVVGLASLDCAPAYIGKTAKDALGAFFKEDMLKMGVHFETPPLEGGPATARCFVFVTPDGERTMNTFLGASSLITPDDISEKMIEAAKIVYLEGYLWDQEKAKQALTKALTLAHQYKKKTAFTLSDSFCVSRHREEFMALITEGKIDILFGNEGEVLALAEEEDLAKAVDRLAPFCRTVVVTLGSKGAMAKVDGKVHSVPAPDIPAVIDTTGAGDLFAAGYLKGETDGLPAEKSLALGCMAAAEVIGHIGPRPEKSLMTLAKEKGLL